MGRRRLRTVAAAELAHYRAHFLEAVREDGIVCLECGGVYRSLPQHVWWHGGTIREYRLKWGYSPSNPLMVPPRVEALRERARALNLVSYVSPASLERARAALLERKPRQSREARLAKSARARAQFASGWRPQEKRRKVDDATLRALVEEGLTISQIAERIGINFETARHRIRRLGLVSSVIAPPARPVSTAELLALSRAGLRAREIAAPTGLTLTAIRSRFHGLRRRGLLLPSDDPRARREALTAQILALARAGLRIREIAARTGLTPGAIRGRLGTLRRRSVAVPSLPGARPNSRLRVSDEQLLALARQGLGRNEIARQLGMAETTTFGRLASLRNRGLLPPDEWRARREALATEVLGLHQAGHSRGEIAARTGLTENAVRKRLARLCQEGLLPASGAPAAGSPPAGE